MTKKKNIFIISAFAFIFPLLLPFTLKGQESLESSEEILPLKQEALASDEDILPMNQEFLESNAEVCPPEQEIEDLAQAPSSSSNEYYVSENQDMSENSAISENPEPPIQTKETLICQVTNSLKRCLKAIKNYINLDFMRGYGSPTQYQYPSDQYQYSSDQYQYSSDQYQYPSDQYQYPSDQYQYPSDQYPNSNNQYPYYQYSNGYPTQNEYPNGYPNQYDYSYNPYSYYGYDNYQQPDRYSSIDYAYNSPHHKRGKQDKGYRSSNIRFGSRFDNSDNFFSSGISSYQGTSTGPGPNGGYPGAPRGIYPTNYVDTSVYPNTYMKSNY